MLILTLNLPKSTYRYIHFFISLLGEALSVCDDCLFVSTITVV